MLCLGAATGASYSGNGDIKPDSEGADVAFTNAPDGGVMYLMSRLEAVAAVVQTVRQRLELNDERVGRNLLVAFDLKAFPEQS